MSDQADEVKVYTMSRKIGDHIYCEQICARNWQEAVETAAKIGATLDGELMEIQCAVCGNGKDKNVKPRLGADEWPDEIGE